jgi:cytochrome c biogenesis protein CcmG/thiol:disulfide interchange protein DsbE
MRRLLTIALIAGLAFSPIARADLEVGTFAPDLEARDWLNTDGRPLSLAELRGMMVVLYFWASWADASKQLLPVINELENNWVLGRKSGVFVIGVTESDRRRVEESVVKAERIFFPIALECEAARDYKITSFPRVVIIDPTGKIAYSGWPNNPEELPKKIIDLFSDTPPFRSHPREAELVRRALEEAKAALRAGDYRTAYIKMRDADESALIGDPLKLRVHELIDLIEALGRDELMRARQLLDEKDYAKATQAIREVARKFRVTRTGKAARRLLQSLKDAYPEVKQALEQSDREAQARAALTSAVELLWERKFGECHEKLRQIAADFAETPAGQDARKLLSRLEKHPRIMSSVRDYQARAECERLLAEARSFRQTGNYDKARQILRSIIEKYPGTSYADTAYRELAELP